MRPRLIVTLSVIISVCTCLSACMPACLHAYRMHVHRPAKRAVCGRLRTHTHAGMLLVRRMALAARALRARMTRGSVRGHARGEARPRARAVLSAVMVRTDRVEAYCRALTGTAMWGGQLEVRALASALGVAIDIYTADAEPLRMSPDVATGAGTEPLRISCVVVCCPARAHARCVWCFVGLV
jgi:hypothetical protein